MITVNKNHVFKIMREKNAPYWFLFEGKNDIDFCQSEGITVDESVEKLDECLSSLSGGCVTVRLSDTTNQRKSAVGSRAGRTFEYVIRLASVTDGGGKPDAMVFTLLKEINTLQVKIVETNYQNQISAFNQKFEELKNEKSNPILDQAIQTLSGLLLNQPGTAAGAAPALAGTPETATTVSPQITSIKESLNILGAIDKNFAENLALLAKLAKDKPATYFSLIPSLKNL